MKMGEVKVVGVSIKSTDLFEGVLQKKSIKDKRIMAQSQTSTAQVSVLPNFGSNRLKKWLW